MKSLKFYKIIITLIITFFVLSCTTHKNPNTNNEEHDNKEEHEDHDHEIQARIVAHSTNGTIYILDGEHGDIIASYKGDIDPGPAFVNVNSTGEFAFITHKDNWQTAVLYTGFQIEEHGDHYDSHLEDPVLLGTFTPGLKTSHFYSSLGNSLFYNDESGYISLLSDQDLISSLDFKRIDVSVEHAAPLLTGNSIIVGLPSSKEIRILDLEGNIKQSFETGNNLHGEGRIGRYVAFGLTEGVSLLTFNGKEYTHKIIPRPLTLDPKVRIEWIKTHILEPKFVVSTNLGAYLGTLDPVTEEWNFTQLPTTFSQFGFDGTGDYFMVLGADGVLYSIDVETLKIKETLKVYEPNSDLPAQSMTLGKAHAWVTNPSNNSIFFISLKEMEIEETFELPVDGNLDSIAIIETIGVAH